MNKIFLDKFDQEFNINIKKYFFVDSLGVLQGNEKDIINMNNIISNLSDSFKEVSYAYRINKFKNEIISLINEFINKAESSYFLTDNEKVIIENAYLNSKVEYYNSIDNLIDDFSSSVYNFKSKKGDVYKRLKEEINKNKEILRKNKNYFLRLNYISDQIQLLAPIISEIIDVEIEQKFTQSIKTFEEALNDNIKQKIIDLLSKLGYIKKDNISLDKFNNDISFISVVKSFNTPGLILVGASRAAIIVGILSTSLFIIGMLAPLVIAVCWKYDNCLEDIIESLIKLIKDKSINIRNACKDKFINISKLSSLLNNQKKIHIEYQNLLDLVKKFDVGNNIQSNIKNDMFKILKISLEDEKNNLDESLIKFFQYEVNK